MCKNCQYNKRFLEKHTKGREHQQENTEDNTTGDAEKLEIQKNICNTEDIEIENENKEHDTSKGDSNAYLDVCENCKRREQDHNFYKYFFHKKVQSSLKVKDY